MTSLTDVQAFFSSLQYICSTMKPDFGRMTKSPTKKYLQYIYSPENTVFYFEIPHLSNFLPSGRWGRRIPDAARSFRRKDAAGPAGSVVEEESGAAARNTALWIRRRGLGPAAVLRCVQRACLCSRGCSLTGDFDTFHFHPT